MKKARGLLIGTIVVVLLGGGLAGADLVARRLGEQAFARQAQTELGLSNEPRVSLGGWPFLVHAATRSFPSASIAIDSLALTPGSTGSLTVTGVEATASDITPQGDGFVVGHAEGSGVVTYASLSEVSGRTITSAGGGRISIAVEVSGVEATVTGTPSLDAEAASVTLSDTTIGFAGVTVPGALSQQILNMFVEPVSVAHDQFTVTSVQAGDDGVGFTATADNVQLPAS
ncbi:LmeA family phospholipid-binding protein [Propionicicella superfundia]|uniref:LmeA family phospholipid-binding protein n=1 Tax=Propionicicella superfundia TaxID=348582 RepID=UPI0003FA9222|nr:DUF2993 domain-containing protein [Propionicicella superfundia]